jgi:3-oxoacyl-[acyl-carrier protein] reductase
MNGQTALVTGGSRGIGRAICLELARKGCNIVLCYAGNETAAQETAAQCEALGREVLTIQCSVGDSQQVKNMMEAAVKRFGRIDILVNNAG